MPTGDKLKSTLLCVMMGMRGGIMGTGESRVFVLEVFGVLSLVVNSGSSALSGSWQR